MAFSWLMKYFKKTKMEDKSNLKHYESEKNISNYLGKCKSLAKKKRKGFYGEVKTLQLKTTLHLSILLQLYPGQVYSTTPHK